MIVVTYKYAYDTEKSDVTVAIEPSQFGQLEMISSILSTDRVKKASMWEVGVGGSIGSKPAFFNGKIYFGACDKNFYCVDLETGEEVWRFATGGPVTTMTAIHSGIVFFGSFDNSFYAVDAETGALVWKFDAQDVISWARPLVYKQAIYTPSLDGNLYKLGLDGKLIWKFAMNGGTGCSPTAWNDTIYVGSSDKNLYAISIDGTLRWKFPTNSYVFSSPAVHDGIVYFGSMDDNVYAADAKTGNLIWKFRAKAAINCSPVIHDGKVYIGSMDHNLYCLNAKDGKLVWKFEMQNICELFAYGEGDVGYVSSFDHHLYAINVDTGKLLWSFNGNGPMINPVYRNGIIYCGSWDCHMYAIDAKTHQLVWKFQTGLSYPSSVDFREPGQESANSEFVWTPEAVQDIGKQDEDKISITDYGEMSGAYINPTKSDYASSKTRCQELTSIRPNLIMPALRRRAM
jgi:outer membrane protein assembly factor BamB